MACGLLTPHNNMIDYQFYLHIMLVCFMRPPVPCAWEVIRSSDGDFAFSMPATPSLAVGDDLLPTDRRKVLTFSYERDGTIYLVQRFEIQQTNPPSAGLITELAKLKKEYFKEMYLIKESKIVVSGVPGDDITYRSSSKQSNGVVTKRSRHFLWGRHYYLLTVASSPGQQLPDEATRFLSSLTFEFLVNTNYSRMNAESRTESKTDGSTSKTLRGKRQASSAKEQFLTSTPEGALKTFILALAAQDETILRAVTLPDPEFDWLLKSQPLGHEQLERMKIQLQQIPMKRLNAGDRVKLPGGKIGIVNPLDVRKGRVVILPEGAPRPSRVELFDGQWRVMHVPSSPRERPPRKK